MPKTFDFEIVFTGICTVAPGLPNCSGKIEKIGVFLVNGWADKKILKEEGEDKSDLRRHGAMVQFDLRNLRIPGVTPNPHPRGGVGVWYPARHHVTFDLVESDPKKNELDIQLARIAEMREYAPGFSSIDPAVVNADPPENLLARFMITRGKVESGNLHVRRWRFPSKLSGHEVFKDLSHEVIVTVRDVTQVCLIANPLSLKFPSGQTLGPGSNTREILEFEPDGGNRVRITIANSCDENPLGWPTPPNPVPDEDFRWHYELLSDQAKANLHRALGGDPLPFPYPDGPPLVEGRNCLPNKVDPMNL